VTIITVKKSQHYSEKSPKPENNDEQNTIKNNTSAIAAAASPPTSLQVMTGSHGESLENTAAVFYRLDALPVTNPTNSAKALKDYLIN